MKKLKQKKLDPRRVANLQIALASFLKAAELQCGLPPKSLSAQNEDSFTFLKPKQVSEIVGISVKTLANKRCSGSGMEFQKIGSRIYYRRSDVVEYCEERKFHNTSQYYLAIKNRGQSK